MGLMDAVNGRLAKGLWRELTYFRDLESTMSREEFATSQVQFREAVVFFNRPLSVLAARVEDLELRASLVDNVWEEHGRGQLACAHQSTFDGLLSAFGRAPESPKGAVLVFNHALMGVCAHGAIHEALAALGMIEGMFAQISAHLGRQILKRGWLESSELVHYTVHETLDVSHSAAFLAPLEAAWSSDRATIERGLRLGETAFLGLYEGLLPPAD